MPIGTVVFCGISPIPQLCASPLLRDGVERCPNVYKCVCLPRFLRFYVRYLGTPSHDHSNAASPNRNALKPCLHADTYHEAQYRLRFTRSPLRCDSGHKMYLYLHPKAKDRSFVNEKIIEAELSLRGQIDSPLEQEASRR